MLDLKLFGQGSPQHFWEMKCLRIKLFGLEMQQIFPIQHAFPFPKLPG